MTARTPPGNRPDPARTDALTIAGASTRLAVTIDAVRRRLHRGTLPGEKVDGVWVLYLEHLDAPGVSPGHRPDTARTPPGLAPVELIAAYEAHLVSKDAEIT